MLPIVMCWAGLGFDGLGLIKTLSQAHWVGPGWAWAGLGLSPGLYMKVHVRLYCSTATHRVISSCNYAIKRDGGHVLLTGTKLNRGVG